MSTRALRDSLTRVDLPFGLPLLVILLAAFVVRVGVGFFSGLDWYTPDSYKYLEMADAILVGSPQSYFPNGYPLLIAVTKVFVPEPAVPSALMWINVGLSTVVVGLTFALTRALHPAPAAALLAATTLAFYPNQLVYMHYLMTEVSTGDWVLLGLVALCSGRAVGGGAALAVATLFRSSLSPVLPIVLGILWIGPDRRRQALRFAAGAAAVLVVHGALLAGGVVGSTRNLSTNLRAAVSQRSSGFQWSEIPEATPEQVAHPVRAYVAFAIDQPREFAMQRMSALWETWGPYPQETPRATWEALLIGLRFPLLLLAMVTFVRQRSRLEMLLLAVPIVVVTAVHFAFFSTARFAYVVMPLVVSLASIALVSSMTPRRTASNRSPTLIDASPCAPHHGFLGKGGRVNPVLRTIQWLLVCAAGLAWASTAASAATLTLDTDKATYDISDTITVTLVAEVDGEIVFNVFSEITWDGDVATSETNSSQDGRFSAFGGFVMGIPGTGTCLDVNGRCAMHDQIIADGVPLDPAVVTATLRMHADAAGLLDLEVPTVIFGNAPEIIVTARAANATVVPEPGTAAMVGLGLLGLAGASRRS